MAGEEPEIISIALRPGMVDTGVSVSQIFAPHRL